MWHSQECLFILSKEKEHPKADIDTGFKVLKLEKSTIKQWDENPENFEAQLELIHSPFTQDSTNDQRAEEIAIKSGIDLEVPPEVDGYRVENGVCQRCI